MVEFRNVLSVFFMYMRVSVVGSRVKNNFFLSGEFYSEVSTERSK